MQRTYVPAALSVALSLSLAAASAAAEPRADRNALQAHVAFLADDLLEGREAGSRGYDIAAGYVAAQFARQGLAPKGDGGGFLQRVPLRSSRIVPGSAKVEIVGVKGAQAFGADEVVVFDNGVPDQANASAPVVFAGYGIRAQRFGHDDYRGLDVKGKIVAVLQGKPASFPTEEGAHFGSRPEKRALAASLGAVGLVTLYTPEAEKAVPFAKVLDRAAFAQMAWVDRDGKPSSAIAGVHDDVALSVAGARKLFAASGASYDDAVAQAAAGKRVAPRDLKVALRLARTSVRTDVASTNVIGMIEGSDPRLKHEYVVFSAHLDHLGQLKDKSGDNIYNGAMDNASGVATMIEAARLFKASGVAPKRSLLFVALTAEEKGLLGADYFATNPTVPRGAIVANVNLDMPLLVYDFKSVIAFGSEHSSLGAAVASAARTMDLTMQPDPWPEQGLFTRSDHYMFVRQGIPAVFLATGMGSFKDEKPAALWKDFLGTHYHQPSDDLRLPFNWDAAARFAEINYRIGLEIANAAERPRWKQGDFFGETFSKKP